MPLWRLLALIPVKPPLASGRRKPRRTWNNPFLHYWALQHAFHADRQFEKAIAAGDVTLALSGRHPFAVSAQANIFANWGKLTAAQAIYEELVARAAQGYVQPTHMAMAA